MKYYIQRQLSEYGPYTLADLQRYIAQGSILLTDLTRSEGMTEWVPVSQVIGNIPIPVSAPPMPPGAPVYGGGMYGTAAGYGAAPAMPMQMSPAPPDFHWALVLLIGIFTCGLFTSAWLIVEAAWIRKIKPDSRALFYIIFAIICVYIGRFMIGFYRTEPDPWGLLVLLAGVVLYYFGVYGMRSDLEDYYTTVERINLQLSGVMVFFFAVYYFQHHFSRIAQWKKTGVLQPQG
jgi:succinate dehydrogenase hydrophobic anchor subunit